MKQLTPRSDCPISFSLDVLGDKWALLILRDMVFAGKSTYGEFLQSAEKMATNILANRLATLESQGFITKEVAADKRSKFTYRLTEKGLDLLPLLLEITLWGAKYSPAGGETTLLQELAADKEATIQKYRQLVQVRNAS
jgi:DNA-binding HxlR family transcriptional regulator